MEGGFVFECEQMRSVLSYPALIELLNDAFASRSRYSVPDRHHHNIVGPGDDRTTTNTLLIMPAWSNTSQQHDQKAYIGVKVVTAFPTNVQIGLSSVLGLYLLSCGRTGRPLALMNGTELTLWRTACASALAAKYLSKQNAEVLTMVGAGALAPHLIHAHLAVRPSISKIFIWNRTHARATEVANNLRTLPNIESKDIEVCVDLEAAIRISDIISCATNSETPLVLGKWLRSGCHLDLVGAYKPTMRECDDEAVKMCRVFVDTPAAISEAGDLSSPISRNVISLEAIVGDLADLAGGKTEGRRRADEITLFKSVGCALEDLAAAQFVYEKLSHHQGYPVLEQIFVSPPLPPVAGLVLAVMSMPNSDIIRYLLFRLRTATKEQNGHVQELLDGLKRELQSSVAIDLRPSSRSSWLRVKDYLDDEDIISLVKAVAELESMPRLTHLDLSHNKIGETAGVALAESLRRVYFPALTHLDLSHNRIGEKSVIALAEVLERGYLSGLTWLDFSQNSYSSSSNGDEESHSLARALMSGNLSNLQHLGLPPCNLDSVVCAFWEGRIKNLTHLHLTGYFPDAAASVRLASMGDLFQIVKHMPLEHIHLRRCGLTWDVMEEFTRALVSRSDGHQCLQHLDLSENSLGVRGVVALGKVMKEGHLSNVTHLSLGLCGIDDIYQIRALEEGIRSGNMPNLTHLDLSSNKLEFLGTCSLVNMIEEGILSNLLHLNLSNCNLRMVAGLEKWRPGKPTRTRSYLEMDERDIFDFIAAVKTGTLSQLRVLDLSFNKLGTQGCTALSGVIKGGYLPHLLQLHLCGCGIKDNGILSLVEAMQGGHLEALQYLDIGFNKFDNPGVEAVAGALKNSLLPNLRFLNLYLIRLDHVPFSREAVASTYESIYGAAAGGEACRSFFRDKDVLVRISFFWAQGKRHERLARREAIVGQMAKALMDAFMLNNKLTAIVVGLGEYDPLFQECRDNNLEARGRVYNPPSIIHETSLAYLTSLASLSIVVISLGLCLYMV